MPCWASALDASGSFGAATLSCPFLRMVLSVRIDGVEVNASKHSQAFSNRAVPLSLASTDHAGHRIIMSTFEKEFWQKLLSVPLLKKQLPQKYSSCLLLKKLIKNKYFSCLLFLTATRLSQHCRIMSQTADLIQRKMSQFD